jgi:hypothetical protein
VLETCALELLFVVLHGANRSAVFDIANGVGRNRTICDFTIASSNMSFDKVRDVFRALRGNTCVKGLSILDDAGKARVLPAVCRNQIVDAMAANVTLEVVTVPRIKHTGEFQKLQGYLDTITSLNRAGRRYIQSPNDPMFFEKAMCVLGAVNNSLECLNFHVREIPSLFQSTHRARKDDTEGHTIGSH